MRRLFPVLTRCRQIDSLCRWRKLARQQGNVAIQREAEAIEDKEGDVALAPLDRAIIGPVHARDESKLLLRQADPLALRPDPVAQFMKDRFLVHRTA